LIRALVCAALLCLAGGASAAEHVIHVSVDGLSGILLQNLIAADATHQLDGFRRFVDEGATTFNARTDYTQTNTLPNHVTMLTGRPVSRPSGAPVTTHHGWTSNDDPDPGVTLHNGGNPALAYVASVFDVADAQGLTTALFASKSKFVLFQQSYPALIGRYLNSSPAAMHATLLAELAASHFDYVFVHYANPDDAGHSSGWGGSAWNAAVRAVDDDLAELFALIQSDPELHDRTLVILSADHGGTGTGHSDVTLAANYTIPFFVWGDGVEAGADLYALNAATRADPGATRPSYTAAVQPIRNGDGANLALRALGLAAVPGPTINGAQDLVTSSLPLPAPIPVFPTCPGSRTHRALRAPLELCHSASDSPRILHLWRPQDDRGGVGRTHGCAVEVPVAELAARARELRQ
jgi:hypothetical protein